jgi:hypothetical protein
MVDKVVMLLSTDWFLPYWSVVGIEATEQKLCVQEGCRQIVHEMVNGATEYYHVNFSDERLRATRQSLRDLATIEAHASFCYWPVRSKTTLVVASSCK